MLADELKPPPPARTPEGRLPADPTVPFKDAAFAMLIHDPPIVSNDATKAALKGALMKWAQTGFEDRVENGSQQYGLEQMMRALGPESVRILPGLITEQTSRLDRIAGLIKDIGDDQSKLDLSKALVGLADRYNSKDWLDGQTKLVKDYNAKNKKPGDADISDAQVAAQVDKIQERRLTEEVFPAMKRVGGQAERRLPHQVLRSISRSPSNAASSRSPPSKATSTRTARTSSTTSSRSPRTPTSPTPFATARSAASASSRKS